MKANFSVYKRTLSGGKIHYYVVYLNPQTGKRDTTKSIDSLNDLLHYCDKRVIRSRTDAILIAEKALCDGLVFNTEKRLFCDYQGQYGALTHLLISKDATGASLRNRARG